MKNQCSIDKEQKEYILDLKSQIKILKEENKCLRASIKRDEFKPFYDNYSCKDVTGK